MVDLETDDGSAFRLVWIGYLPNGEVFKRISSTHIVGVESPEGGGFSPARVKNIILTSRWAGKFSAVATERGCRVVEAPPEEWRKAIVGKRTPSDREIKDVVVPMIFGWPRQSRDHHRDAAGMAMYAARMVVGRMVA